MRSTEESRIGERPTWPARGRLEVATVGSCKRPSPISPDGEPFVDDTDRVLLCRTTRELARFADEGLEPPSFERAGARPIGAGLGLLGLSGAREIDFTNGLG